MFSFLRSREGSSVLDKPSPESTAQYLCRLMAEQNALLRELIQGVTGHPSQIVRAAQSRPKDTRLRTDKDVFRVGRDQVLQMERKQEEARVAPHRSIPANGPDSAPENSAPGNGKARE